MFESIKDFFQKFGKNKKEESKNTAKERLHLVLAQDRANISADFLEMMKQEIIDVIKKYIDIDEEAIDVKLTNNPGEDGTMGAPSLYANIPIVTIKNEARKLEKSILQDKDKVQEEEKKTGEGQQEDKEEKEEDTQPEENITTEQSVESDKEEIEETEQKDTTKDNPEKVETDSSKEHPKDQSSKEQEKGKEEKNEEKNS